MKTFPYTAPIFARLLLDQADRIKVERESFSSVTCGSSKIIAKAKNTCSFDISPRREAWYCPIQQDGPDSTLHFAPLGLRSDAPPVTGYIDTDIRVLDGLGSSQHRRLTE